MPHAVGVGRRDCIMAPVLDSRAQHIATHASQQRAFNTLYMVISGLHGVDAVHNS